MSTSVQISRILSRAGFSRSTRQQTQGRKYSLAGYRVRRYDHGVRVDYAEGSSRLSNETTRDEYLRSYRQALEAAGFQCRLVADSSMKFLVVASDSAST
jgi:hypothetical protein